MAQETLLTLEDGRVLGVLELGDPEGFPVVYCHGGNSSRLEALWFEEAARTHHIRLISPDRPGFGLSDFQPERSFLHWARDVEQVVDTLGVGDFSIFGLSGGGPHAAVVAHQLPTRVQRAAIISGVAPPSMPQRLRGVWFPLKLLFFFARYLPFLKRFFLAQMGAFYSDKEQMERRMLQAMPAPDVALIRSQEKVLEVFAKSAQEAHRTGIEGDAWEWHLYVHPWGFSLSDISLPVGLWYGKYDKQAPAHMGMYLTSQLPNSQLYTVEDGGHFSTIHNHIHAIFDFLASS